jgi:hypothetical protein
VLAQAFAPDVKRFAYPYVFGDDWEHEVQVEALLDDAYGTPAAV